MAKPKLSSMVCELETCSNVFYFNPLSKRTPRKFCSLSCKYKNRRPRYVVQYETRVCVYCESEFKISVKLKGRFCGSTCANLHKIHSAKAKAQERKRRRKQEKLEEWLKLCDEANQSFKFGGYGSSRLVKVPPELREMYDTPEWT